MRAYDPEGMKTGPQRCSRTSLTPSNAYACMEGADALVIVTEWDEFRALDLARVKSLLARPILVDLRNIYRPEDMASRGFTYVGIGRAGVPDGQEGGV